MAMARPLALVTGASAGIGAACARQLAERGYDLALVARRADRLEALGAELSSACGITCQAIPADLAAPDAHLPIIAALGGRAVSCLVNNAGLTVNGDFAANPWERQRDALMVLAVAVAGLTNAVLPEMIARNSGRIITISSILALSQGGPGNTLYPASKAFAHLFMLSLDAEVRQHGIICTSVLPGSTSSEFRAANDLPADSGNAADWFVQTPEQVAAAAIAGNARGKLIVIPGMHNHVAAAAMKIAPGAMMRWLGRRIAN